MVWILAWVFANNEYSYSLSASVHSADSTSTRHSRVTLVPLSGRGTLLAVYYRGSSEHIHPSTARYGMSMYSRIRIFANVWDPILALARVFTRQILASIGHVFVPLLTLIVPDTLELLLIWVIYIIGRPNIELYMAEILPEDEIFDVRSTYGAYIGSGGAI